MGAKLAALLLTTSGFAILVGSPAVAQEPAVAQKESRLLRDGFRSPPSEARPQVWWHWLDGNVTEEGALLDLEWMHRMGIGGVHAFAGGGLEPTVVPQPLSFMSPGWKSAYRSAVAKARQFGMDVTIAASPGWSQSGGPWVRPDQAMKKYVWSELQLAGGQRAGKLPPLPNTTGPFQAAPVSGGAEKQRFGKASGEAAVFAFPEAEAHYSLQPSYSTNVGPSLELAGLPEDLSKVAFLPASTVEKQTHVRIDLKEKVLISAIKIAVKPLPTFQISVSDDGVKYRVVSKQPDPLAEAPAAQQTFALPAVRARFVEVQFAPPARPPHLPGTNLWPGESAPTQLEVRALRVVSTAMVDRFEAKAGFQPTVDHETMRTPISGGLHPIDKDMVVDLTGRLKADGTLDWTAPKGRWTVVRLGWSLTGQTNGPAEKAATGLEVDKLDAGAVKSYLNGLLDLYNHEAGVPLGQNGIGGLLSDSWEAGVQNWTPAILNDFRRLRGYDPTPWLPVLTGRVVRNASASDAFLEDFRQTLKDLLAANHYGVLASGAHARGMTFYAEAQGDNPRAIGDGLAMKAQADIPTAEFWYRPFATTPGQPSLVADMREAASAAHLYGKPFVAAEAMTVAAARDPWSFSPAMLKPVADEIFASGVNRLLVHESHMQPFKDRKPGLMMAIFGQFFNRNATWAEDQRPWVDYLARTSYMLQQGKYVADVAYFYGEEKSLAQLFQNKADDAVPSTYGFDYINADVIQNILRVEDGRLKTKGGMTYRVLYMPEYVTRLTPSTIQNLERLVAGGAVLVGRKPTGILGMDKSGGGALAALDRLWGSGTSHMRLVGLGRVYGTSDLSYGLRAEAISPDVQYQATASLLTMHRRVRNQDIYFVSNRKAERLLAPVRFRATGRPELWSAVDGSSRPLSFARNGEITEVVVPLESHGAGFVVFTPDKTEKRVVIEPNTVNSFAVQGPWKIDFEDARGAPSSITLDSLTDLTTNRDPGVRYFSGAATYNKSVLIEAGMRKKNQRIVLDLGQVNDLAVVTVDGRPAGTAWTAPFQLDLTNLLSIGAHNIKIKVVNSWVNRLIGDRQPGATPIAWAPQSPYKADSELSQSGLLGPVRLLVKTSPVITP